MSSDVFMNILGTRPKGVLILCWILCVVSSPNIKFQENAYSRESPGKLGEQSKNTGSTRTKQYNTLD